MSKLGKEKFLKETFLEDSLLYLRSIEKRRSLSVLLTRVTVNLVLGRKRL